MKMEIKLDEKEIKIAIDEYIAKKGWNVISVSITTSKGDSRDPRESSFSHTSATIRVETIKEEEKEKE